ncbi:MAG: metal ABC transporter ATP-binding protein [Clostridia bacterium]|nr:MAG: metal ABC transporter ATP-binding protein [Clostridia bacterium]
MEHSAAPLIRLENVSFARGPHRVLQGVSLQVHAGEFLGLVGPNGAGKTTLIQLILGLLPPASGRVLVLGEEPQRLGKKRSLIGYLPQRPLVDPHFPASVFDVVRMGRTVCRGLWRFWHREDDLAVYDTLQRLHLEGLAKRPIGELSGGQQQLVFLARALVSRPCLLLVDEPTTGLDREAQDRFYSLINTSGKESDLTVVAVSHDLSALVQHTSRMIYLNGTLEEAGPVEQERQVSPRPDLLPLTSI